MNWQNILSNLNSFFTQVLHENGIIKLSISLAVLIIGIIIVEIILRLAYRRMDQFLKRKGYSDKIWQIKNIILPLRLAAISFMFQLIEPFFSKSDIILKILNSGQTLILISAVLLILYYFIEKLDHLRFTPPNGLPDQFPETELTRLKRFLKITTLVFSIILFLYTQRFYFSEPFIHYPLWRYLFVLAVFLFVSIAMPQIGSFLTKLAIAFRTVEEKIHTRLIIEGLIWPIRFLLVALLIYTVKGSLDFPASMKNISNTAADALIALVLIIFLYRLIELFIIQLSSFAQRDDNLLDQNFVALMRIISRVIVIIIGSIYLLRIISGKPINALLAGLGIGALAVALAAQDTLKNFFGSIMIMLDKPFTIGQRIIVEGHDGVIEQIGFRSTRVRTLTGHLVTVPNDKMATSSVENIGQRPSIRRLTNITITYDTPPEKVEKAVCIIREILDNHEGMDPEFPPRVYFNEFNDTSLNILMVYWYFPPDYWAYLDFSERINLEIMNQFEKEGIEFAFPTTTTYLAHDARRPLKISIDDR